MADTKVKDVKDPGRDIVAVTPHDTNLLPGGTCRALYIGGGGNLVITTPESGATTRTVYSVPSGSILPVQCVRVLATSTTATNIMAIY